MVKLSDVYSTFVGRAVVVSVADPPAVAAVEVGGVRVAEDHPEPPADQGADLLPADLRVLLRLQVRPVLQAPSSRFY